MSEHDVVHEAVERLEWSERNDDPTPLSRWREVTRRSALTGGAVGLTAFLLEACGGGSNKSTSKAQSGTPATGVFGEQKPFKFTFVNHVTTNPFFVPTKYGAEDACKLLGCTYQWTGSESSNINEMVNAFNSAVSAKVDGIAVALVDLKAFNGPIKKALDAGIPVVGYNADAPDSGRLAYIGQDLFVSGQEMGKHIIDLVGSRRRRAVHRHAGTAEHPAAHRRRARHDQEVGRLAHRAHDHHGRRAAEGAVGDRRLLARPQGHEGHVRRGRRQHPGRRPDDQEVQHQRQGEGRGLRPAAADHGTARRPARSTSRSISSRICRGSCRCWSCTCTRRRRP